MNGEEFLPSLPLRGQFTPDGAESDWTVAHRASGKRGWRAAIKPEYKGFYIGMELARRRGQNSDRAHVQSRHFTEGNNAQYLVHYDDCAVAWVSDGVWKTIHSPDFVAAPEVAQVEDVLRKAGIEWEELT